MAKAAGAVAAGNDRSMFAELPTFIYTLLVQLAPSLASRPPSAASHPSSGRPPPAAVALLLPQLLPPRATGRPLPLLLQQDLQPKSLRWTMRLQLPLAQLAPRQTQREALLAPLQRLGMPREAEVLAVPPPTRRRWRCGLESTVQNHSFGSNLLLKLFTHRAIPLCRRGSCDSYRIARARKDGSAFSLVLPGNLGRRGGIAGILLYNPKAVSLLLDLARSGVVGYTWNPASGAIGRHPRRCQYP